MREGEGLTVVVEFAGIDAMNHHAGVADAQPGRVAGQEEELAGLEQGAIGEAKLDAVGEEQTGQV